MLHSHFGSSDPRVLLERTQIDVATHFPELAAAMPALLELIGVQSANPAWRSLQPTERRRQIIDACRGWLIAESRRQPVVFVADDLQWIDVESAELLRSLVNVIGNAPILLLLSCRPDYLQGVADIGAHTHIRLEPLTSDESAELFDDAVGSNVNLKQLRTRLIERAAGNPLYLSEILRALTDAGALSAEALPPTVQAIVAARIDALSPSEKGLLQAAAVLGQEFDLSHLVGVLSLDESEVRTILGRLQGKCFLQERRVFPEISFGFDHPLNS